MTYICIIHVGLFIKTVKIFEQNVTCRAEMTVPKFRLHLHLRGYSNELVTKKTEVCQCRLIGPFVLY